MTLKVNATFDAESKYGVDAVLTLKVNAQKCGVNFFRKSMRYVRYVENFLIPKMTKMTKVTKIFFRRCDERDRSR